MNERIERLIKSAKALKNRNFGAAQHNQCANFVRQAFKDAGIHLPIAASPSDAALVKRQGYGFGETLADSFAGNEVGPKVPLSQAQMGDIIMFKNTDPSYTSGTITHVGICVDNKTMIDRGGSAVNIRPWAQWPGLSNVVEVRRPNCLHVGVPVAAASKPAAGVGTGAASGGDPMRQLKIYYHDKKLGGSYAGGGLEGLDIHIKVTNGHLAVSINHDSIHIDALELELKSASVFDAAKGKFVHW